MGLKQKLQCPSVVLIPYSQMSSGTVGLFGGKLGPLQAPQTKSNL